jgi:lysozyme
MEILIERIKQHEGYKSHIYIDSKGNLTCGWGHHLWNGSPISKEINELFLRQDLANAVSDFRNMMETFDVPVVRVLNMSRRRVIVEMLFNMGMQKVLGFKKMWKCIKGKDWSGAKREMLESKWHEDVGERAEILADIMERGTD